MKPLRRESIELPPDQEQVHKLLTQLHDLQKQKEAVERALQGVLSSKSWRLTAPLRWLAEQKRTLLPLWRRGFCVYDLAPLQGVELNGKALTLTGTTPRLAMRGPIPSGWVSINGDAGVEQGQLFCLLLYRLGDEFTEEHRVWVPLPANHRSGTITKLPEGIKELALEFLGSATALPMPKVQIRELGTLQLVWSFFDRYVVSSLRQPKALWGKCLKLIEIVKDGGVVALRAKLFQDSLSSNYHEWVKRYDTLGPADFEAAKALSAALSLKPRISVIMPTYNTPAALLRAAIESVCGQTYPDWELCIADDCSTLPHVQSIVEEYAAREPRIKWYRRGSNGHISKATNDALKLASGEFVAFLDHDDELRPHALTLVAEEINRFPESSLVYSDEDKITSTGVRFNPYFKPDWNPELFLSQNYICHLAVYRRSLVEAVGGMREGVDGAQDWDLAWRIIERSRPEQIRHIPHVLYHWRVVEGSTAQSTSFKPYVLEAQKKTIEDHLQRTNDQGKVEILHGISQLRVRRTVAQPSPLVSIIIPTKDRLEYLKRTIESILARSEYRNFEILIVDNGSVEGETKQYLETLADPCRVIRDERPFNFSRLNNGAVLHARGSIVAFLNNDLEVVAPEWLTEMVALAIRPEVGAVGARLYYPNGLLQHGGVVLGINGVAGHSHKGRRRGDPGNWNRIILPHNVSAVTAACMLVRREVFDEVGGFDEEELAVAFNDVDFCLKVRSKGYVITYQPYAELLHYESVSRGYETTPEKFARFERETEVMKRRWGYELSHDPYYNPNLTLLTEDFTFAFPPRIQYSWRQ